MILVTDEERNGGAGRVSLEDPGEDLDLVGFIALGDEPRLPRSAPIQVVGSSSGRSAGEVDPSMTTPTPPPWDSPKVETRARVPNSWTWTRCTARTRPVDRCFRPRRARGRRSSDARYRRFGRQVHRWRVRHRRVVPGLDFVDDVVGTPAQLGAMRAAPAPRSPYRGPPSRWRYASGGPARPRDGVHPRAGRRWPRQRGNPTGKDFVVIGFVTGDVEHGEPVTRDARAGVRPGAREDRVHERVERRAPGAAPRVSPISRTSSVLEPATGRSRSATAASTASAAITR